MLYEIWMAVNGEAVKPVENNQTSYWEEAYKLLEETQAATSNECFMIKLIEECAVLTDGPCFGECWDAVPLTEEQMQSQRERKITEEIARMPGRAKREAAKARNKNRKDFYNAIANGENVCPITDKNEYRICMNQINKTLQECNDELPGLIARVQFLTERKAKYEMVKAVFETWGL